MGKDAVGEACAAKTSLQCSINPVENSIERSKVASPLYESPCPSFQIYHEGERHKLITPTVNASRERYFGPTAEQAKENRRARQKLKEKSEEHSCNDSFFLHTPYLAFHDPPRVLYVGPSKHHTPVALIQGSFLWRSYRIQLGSSLAAPGVLDPRGVVSWQHNGGSSKQLKADDRKLKGYKVRTWRLWGETGKSYVREIKAARKMESGGDPDVDKEPVFRARGRLDSAISMPSEKASHPVSADDVVYLKWTAPFSRDTRRYHFRYHGVDFYWKGTGTVKESRMCGWFLHFNHLKLIAMLPLTESEDTVSTAQHEVCLGKYTSSIAKEKSGSLDLYDAAIWRLMTACMPSALVHVKSYEGYEKELFSKSAGGNEIDLVRKTTLYQTIVATAMCMILQEKQKRETIRKLIELAATEGAGNA